jgi:hypothetical protein
MRRAVHLLILAAAMLTFACHRKAEQSRPPAQAPAPAPMSFAESTPDADVKLTLDPAIGAHSGLRGLIYDDGVKELKSFVAEAQNDRAHLAGKGMETRPYQRTVAWTLTAESSLLLSARKDWFDDTGGAHPNHGAEGLLWDIVGDRPVARRDLFRPDADQAALDAALCEAVKAAKRSREGAVADVATWPCPKWADANFVLAPSTVPKKLGGLIFLFDPYVVGPYSEGGYEVTAPQSDFRAAVAPAYADEFAGEPKPAPAARPGG